MTRLTDAHCVSSNGRWRMFSVEIKSNLIQGGLDADSLAGFAVFVSRVAQAARSGADSHSIAGAWDWGDDRSFQRHLCPPGQSIPLQGSKPDGTSDTAKRE